MKALGLALRLVLGNAVATGRARKPGRRSARAAKRLGDKPQRNHHYDQTRRI